MSGAHLQAKNEFANSITLKGATDRGAERMV